MQAIHLLKSALRMNEMDLALIEDMRDAPLKQPTQQGGNHPLWVIGHLTFTEPLFRSMITGQPNPLDEWNASFGPGTQPHTNLSAYPDFDEIVSEFKSQRARTIQLLDELGDSGLDLPPVSPPDDMPDEVVQQFFSTNGQMFMTIAIHHAFHCGQVADARRADMREPMFM